MVQQIAGGTLVRRAAVAMSGSAAGQAAMIVATPILSRLYDPVALGVLAVFIAIVGIVYVVAGLRYESAVSLPSDAPTARSVLWLSCLFVVAVSVATGAVATVVGDRLTLALNVPELAPYIWLVGPTVLAAGLFQNLSTWSVRIGAFGVIAWSRAVQGVTTAVIQVVGGFDDANLLLLLISVTAGWLAGAAVLALPLLVDRVSDGSFTRTSLGTVARRYVRFPKFAIWSSLLNRGALEIPPLALSAIYGPASAGLFLLAYRVLISPANIAIQAVYQVYVHRGSELIRDDPPGLEHLFSRMTRRMFVWTIPFVVLLLVAAPQLFEFVFGPEWREAGVYAQVMAMSLLFLMPTGAVSASFSLLERPDLELSRELARVVMIGAAFGLASVLAWTQLAAIAAYTAAIVVGSILLLVLAHRQIHLRSVAWRIGNGA